MVLLPMVMRELRVRSRRSSTVYVRVAAAGIVLLIGLLLILSVRGGGRIMVSSMVYQVLSVLLLAFCMVEGARSSAGIICDERREGTLGFLFLTDLSGVDVLLGKLAGAALQAIYAVLATVPVLSLVVLLGGITGAEVFRASLVFLSTLALSLVVGAAVSTRARDAVVSTLISLVVMVLLSLVPPAVDAIWQSWSANGWRPASSAVALLSPVVSMEMAMEPGYTTSPTRFWLSQGLQWAVGMAVFLSSAWSLQSGWRTEPETETAVSPRAISAEPGAPRRVGASAAEVIATAMVRRVGLMRWLVVLVVLDLIPHVVGWVISGGTAATGIVSFTLYAPMMLTWIGGMLLAAHLTVRILSETVRSGEMEIFLTTPMDSGELVGLIWRSLRPLVVWMTVCGAVEAVISLTIAAWNGLPNPPFQFVWQVASQVGGVAATAVCYAALVWIGMWQGLVRRGTASAVAWTVGIVGVVAPLIGIVAQAILSLTLVGTTLGPKPTLMVAVMAMLPYVVRIAVYAGCISWARKLLYLRFREAASGIHQAA
ncbi:MAG: ABC transporter permease subunit [Verrucomicrobiales bacterium]|nr:ABC transporter permease subunit [Verrucomicrobiales bacterium]